MTLSTRENELALSIDEILPYIGEFGRFQITLEIILIITCIPFAYQVFIMYFATITPSWKCIMSNGSACTFNGTFPKEDFRRCHMLDREWEYVEGNEFSLVTQFHLDCEQGWILALISSLFFVGWGVGAIALGFAADRYGRKTFMFPSLAVTIVVGLVTPYLPSLLLIGVCRFVIGIVFPGVIIQVVILTSELVGTEQRPLATALPNLALPIGFSILALKAYLLKNWKWLSIACTAPYIFIFSFYTYVPESVRWLYLHDRCDDAMAVFRKVAKRNKKELPSNIILSRNSSKPGVKSKSNLLKFLKTPRAAKESIVQICIWLFAGLTTYGLHLAASDLEGSVYRDFVLISIVEMPSNILSIITCKRFGRKIAALVPLVVAGSCSLGIAWIPAYGTIKVIRVILGVTGKLAVIVTFQSLYIWSAELFPTDVRSTAMGILQVSARIGSAASPWIMGGLYQFGAWIPFCILGVASLIGSALGIVLPETRARNMQESLSEVEGKTMEDFAKKGDVEDTC